MKVLLNTEAETKNFIGKCGLHDLGIWEHARQSRSTIPNSRPSLAATLSRRGLSARAISGRETPPCSTTLRPRPDMRKHWQALTPWPAALPELQPNHAAVPRIAEPIRQLQKLQTPWAFQATEKDQTWGTREHKSQTLGTPHHVPASTAH